MKQRMLAWLCAGILGLGCWGLPAAAADDTTEPTTQVTTEAETETESSKFSTKDVVTAVIVFTLVTAGTATGVLPRMRNALPSGVLAALRALHQCASARKRRKLEAGRNSIARTGGSIGNTPLPSLRNGKSCASGVLRTLRHDFRGERTAANSTAKPADVAAKCTGYLLWIRPE